MELIFAGHSGQAAGGYREQKLQRGRSIARHYDKKINDRPRETPSHLCPDFPHSWSPWFSQFSPGGFHEENLWREHGSTWVAKRIAAKRWKLGEVTCGHGLVISSFIADWAFEFSWIFSFKVWKRGIIIWDIYLFRTRNLK